MEVVFNVKEFAGDAMNRGWYDGKQAIHSLQINAGHLETIHANAFNAPAFQKMRFLTIHIDSGSVTIHHGAFHGTQYLMGLTIDPDRINGVASGLFAPAIATLKGIFFFRWPNDMSLDEVFADDVYHMLFTIVIRHVVSPQTKFRALTATNFTSIRRLNALSLVDCGIETIDLHTFDVIGRTLRYLSLSDNRIKFISVDMFRNIIESKYHAIVVIKHNAPLECSCETRDVNAMQYPLMDEQRTLIDCTPSAAVSALQCATYQELTVAKLCVKWLRSDALRFIKFRMTFDNDSIWIQTNFTSKFRVLFINADTMHAKCAKRADRSAVKCLLMNGAVEGLHLHEVNETRDAKLTLITVIPMLFEHGTCPMHSISVRQRGQWNEALSINMVIMVWWFGFVLGIWIVTRKRR